MAATLAHEVKNPLSLVKANIDLLELLDAEKDHAKNYRIMRREIERINDMLLDFIQFAKPIDTELAPIEMMPMITEILDMIKLSYGNRDNLQLQYSCDEAGLCVMGDADKIRRVFLNVIKNGMEAIAEKEEEETGLIQVSIHGEKNWVRIMFMDNGKGMDDEQLQKLNRPFYTTKLGGSGLGLMICRNIVEEHRGLFEIAGKPGEGCSVTITLPRADFI